jgi:hypothetical protein
MRKWMKWTLGVVGGLALVVVGGGLLLPSKWGVTRSRVIPAPPAAIHAYVGDFAKWPQWCPFDREDPTTRIALGATTSGVGGSRSWTSDRMGNGSQTITRTDPERGVAMRLDIDGFPPFEGEFAYETVAGGTNVTWTDRGDVGASPINRWFALFCESMMGPTFEKGLADLDAAVVAER